jgi:hypothetical protein
LTTVNEIKKPIQITVRIAEERLLKRKKRKRKKERQRKSMDKSKGLR